VFGALLFALLAGSWGICPCSPDSKLIFRTLEILFCRGAGLVSEYKDSERLSQLLIEIEIVFAVALW